MIDKVDLSQRRGPGLAYTLLMAADGRNNGESGSFRRGHLVSRGGTSILALVSAKNFPFALEP